MLNEYEMMQPKFRNLEMLTSDHNKSETQSDIVAELIHLGTEEISVKWKHLSASNIRRNESNGREEP